ncbi:response regulator transcription factor [Paenibacillus mesotrionivorans]|uniref:Response regulator transcription factor n=1 Tax=Paenibacillus mesotrionivorans TaxID=3160968 RepID=A0ACC7P2E3_9BACL
MNPTILLLEDDRSLIDGLQYALTKNGFSVEVAHTIAEAEAFLSERTYDLLLLDVALPDGNGFEVCERIRRQGNAVPIIFLTASDEEVNVIRGLDIGGDDYMTKPFKLGELCSRIRALLRRAGKLGLDGSDSVLESGGLRIDLLGSRVMLQGKPVELTGMEYRLLCLLVRHTGRVLPRNLILDSLWDGTGDYVDDNTLSVYIRRLREKLERDPSHPERLATVRGFGYQWNEVHP